MAVIEIKQYDVAFYAGGRNAAGYPYRAIIGLRDEGGRLVGAAYFHLDASKMPGADTQKASGYVSCHYAEADYPHVLDLLRNEKPVYVEFEAGVGNVASIRTSAEPVGEGELSSADWAAPRPRHKESAEASLLAPAPSLSEDEM